MKHDEFEVAAKEIRALLAGGNVNYGEVLAQLLHARVMNGIARTLDALLLEVDPESLVRRVRGDDDSDVRLQAEVNDFDAGEDTIDERTFTRPVQVRQEDLDDIGRKVK